ncbi:MAG: DUF4224 domain-containing protein [Rubrivivax sp.]|jgi:hypothetical protein|nr:DUF4224 domain-containing protein [Rubrivivax sp.]
MLTLTPHEIAELTGYTQPSRQLAELRRQGFYRARRNVLGNVVLERGHYDAVVAGRDLPPPLTPQLRQPRLRPA